MKLLIVAVCLATLSCAGLTPAPFERAYSSDNIPKPADLKKLEAAILISLTTFNWKVVSNSEGKILSKYEKGDDQISATIEIQFSAEGYSVNYVDSKNLNVDLVKMKIHGNYVRWIKNLIKQIGIEYLRQP